MPAEYTSLRGLASPSRTCSGDRYAAVPKITLVEVIPAAATARTNPKSAIFTSPSSEINTFSGLTSRCTRPARCAAANPPSTGRSTAATA